MTPPPRCSGSCTSTGSSAGYRRTCPAASGNARPTLVAADEPNSELDAENRATVIALLRAAAAGGATVIIATHVADACDQQLHLAAAFV